LTLTGLIDRPEFVNPQLTPLRDGGSVHATHLISHPGGRADQPHAFLTTQSPGSTFRAHFHFNRQFQVAVRGSGLLGRHPLGLVTVHYAAAETGYGPIVAGDGGLSYFTLRQVFERGAQYLPDNAPSMHQGLRRRQKTSPVIDLHDAVDGVGEAATTEIFPLDETGLGAWLIRVGPGVMVDAPLASADRDRYHVIVGGSVRTGEDELPELSVVWVGRGEPSPRMIAGPQGGHVLVLQFPVSD
jgi:hypothetical protein